MTKTRNIADLLDANGDVVAGALDNVPAVDLTNLSATNLTSGTVPDARFPATLPALNGSALTTLNASNLTSGTLADARFPATLPSVSGANLTNLPGGGKINQVLMASKTNTQVSSSANSWVDVSGLSLSITPSASNSKILIHFCCNISCSVNNHAAIKLVRGSTDIFVHDVDNNNVRLFSGWRTTDASQYHAQVQTGSFLDSPSTTSAITYYVKANGNDGFNINRPHAGDNQSTVQRTRGASSIILMEVLA
tara:strand:+ start:42 stop:794 length:753 start_codon:yes stop_codon:yes gene_type:complete